MGDGVGFCGELIKVRGGEGARFARGERGRERSYGEDYVD